MNVYLMQFEYFVGSRIIIVIDYLCINGFVYNLFTMFLLNSYRFRFTLIFKLRLFS